MRILTKEQTDYFYHLSHHLILFTNKRYRLYDYLKTPDDINITNAKSKKALLGIRSKMYSKENIKEFCKNPPDGIEKDDLLHISEWKNNLSGEFYIMRHLEDYTVFMVEADPFRLYGIKSLNDD